MAGLVLALHRQGTLEGVLVRLALSPAPTVGLLCHAKDSTVQGQTGGLSINADTVRTELIQGSSYCQLLTSYKASFRLSMQMTGQIHSPSN